MSTSVMTHTPTENRLRLEPLLHPSEFSRMLLAAAAVVIAFGAYVAFWLAFGGPAALAIVSASILLFVGSFWLGLQLYRAQLLGRSIRVSESSLPDVQALIDDVRSQLDYDRRVDVYITQKAAPSVSIKSYLGTKVIVIEGSLIGDLVDEERAQMSFLLARSFAALKVRHDRFAVALPLLDGLRLYPFVSPWLLPYFRASTYSGDQIGLVCCGSLETALTATKRLLVGKEVEPQLHRHGVVTQAEVVRRRWLPRLIQLALAEPHLTNRYANLVLFCSHHDPAALRAFRATLDDATAKSLDGLARRSPHRRPASSRSRRVALGTITTFATAGILAGTLAIVLSMNPADDYAHAASDYSAPPAAPDVTPASGGGEPVGQQPAGSSQLLEHIPAALRESCAPAEIIAPDAVAAVQCESAGSTIYYNLFGSAEDLEDQFETSRSLHSAAAGGEDCETGSFEGPWTSAGETAGQLLCWQADGTSWIAWTHDDLLVGADMLRSGDDSEALYSGWLEAGPQ